MVPRYVIKDRRGLPCVGREHPEGDWVRFEDVQVALALAETEKGPERNLRELLQDARRQVLALLLAAGGNGIRVRRDTAELAKGPIDDWTISHYVDAVTGDTVWYARMRG